MANKTEHPMVTRGKAAIEALRAVVATYQAERNAAGIVVTRWPVTDLVHDEAAITKFPEYPFAWFLGANGTHMVRCMESTSPRVDMPRTLLATFAESFPILERQLYFWDGHKLHACPTVEALADRYVAELDALRARGGWQEYTAR